MAASTVSVRILSGEILHLELIHPEVIEDTHGFHDTTLNKKRTQHATVCKGVN